MNIPKKENPSLYHKATFFLTPNVKALEVSHSGSV